MDKAGTENGDLVVEISEDQLALPIETKDELQLEPQAKPEQKPDTEAKRERKRHNDDVIKSVEAQLRQREADLEAERAERVRLAEELAQARAVAAKAQEHVVNSDYERIQGAIAAAKSREESLKREIQSAAEIGEHGKVAELHMEAARIAARKLQYEDAKRNMEIRAERAAKEAPAREERAPVAPVDPFEARIAGLSAQSQAWLRQHKECVLDEVKNAKVLWGHKEAERQGIRADTPEYFRFLETHMGYADDNGDDAGDDDDADVEVTPARRSAPAAPVSRDSSTGQVAPNKYRLSREEAEIATQLNMTPTEYATWKLKAIKDGRYAN